MFSAWSFSIWAVRAAIRSSMGCLQAHMLQSCPHILTEFIVIIIENENKGNDIRQRSERPSNSRFKGWGYPEIKQVAGSLVDISHHQVYCSALCDSIISKLSKKPKVLLNGFLTEYLLT